MFICRFYISQTIVLCLLCNTKYSTIITCEDWEEKLIKTSDFLASVIQHFTFIRLNNTNTCFSYNFVINVSIELTDVAIVDSLLFFIDFKFTYSYSSYTITHNTFQQKRTQYGATGSTQGADAPLMGYPVQSTIKAKSMQS